MLVSIFDCPVALLCFTAFALFVLSKALAGVLMTMLDKGVRIHPDSYSIVIAQATKVMF